jgi:MlaD protein
MSAPARHWRLGAFVLLVATAVVAAAIGLGDWSTHPRTTEFVTYFDESVGGLESGAHVTFRGVVVGSVARIAIAPDHRHVEVTYGLYDDALPRMGIGAVPRDHRKSYVAPPELRAQIGGNGLTGVRNVSIDLFDPRTHPAPALSFAVPPAYVPATRSTLDSLEDVLTTASWHLPELVEALVQDSRRVDAVLAELERNHVSDRAAATLARADAALVAFGTAVRRIDGARVPEKTSRTLGDASAALSKMGRVLDGIASSTGGVDQALDELRDTAQAIRVLAEDLDHDPDMLLKGRAAGGQR